MKFFRIVTVTCTVLFFQHIYAQETTATPNKTPIKIGIKAGYSLGELSNRVENTYTKNYESVSGVDFGLIAEFTLSKLLAIQTELNLTQRGGVRSGMQPVTSTELSDQLNSFLPFIGQPLITNENPLYANFKNESDLKYAEVPVLAKIGFGNKFRIALEVGPYVGILLKSTQHTSGTSQFYYDEEGTVPVTVPVSDDLSQFVELPEQSLDANTDTKDSLHIVNFGGIVGLGLSAELGAKSMIFADARASYSFNSIQINDEFGKSHIGGVIFSLGYAYSIQ